MRQANGGARWLVETLAGSSSPSSPVASLNMLELLLAPGGFLARIVNLSEVGPTMLSHLRADAVAHPALAAKVEALSAAMQSATWRNRSAGPLGAAPRPGAHHAFRHPLRCPLILHDADHLRSPQAITLASLRVEHMFAADAATAEVDAEVRLPALGVAHDFRIAAGESCWRAAFPSGGGGCKLWLPRRSSAASLGGSDYRIVSPSGRPRPRRVQDPA